MHRPLPPLESGDCLSRDEFERRYEIMPGVKKAELIEGVVYMPPAVRMQGHGFPHGRLITWLGVYQANTPGVIFGDNTSVRLDLDNEPQPDAIMLLEAECGGQAMIDEEDYVVHGPELVGEVSASSVSIDLNQKRNVYRRNGVREYIVWRVFDQQIDWFVLRGAEYQSLTPNDQGQLRSEQFPGLWLDVSAMTSGNLARVLEELNSGLETSAHSQFVKRLADLRQSQN